MTPIQLAGATVVAAALVAVAAGISRGQSEPVWDLYCNDTKVAPMRVEVELVDIWRPVTATTGPTTASHVTLFRNFQKAAKAGGVEKPAPGFCTWLDRPINPDEPGVLGFRSRNIGT